MAQTVTAPLERQFGQMPGLSRMSSTSAAGVSIVGPSNLITLLETIPPYWASARAFFSHSMGDSFTLSMEMSSMRRWA